MNKHAINAWRSRIARGAQQKLVHLVQCPLTRRGTAGTSPGSRTAKSGPFAQHSIVPQALVSKSGAMGPPGDSDTPQKGSLCCFAGYMHIVSEERRLSHLQCQALTGLSNIEEGRAGCTVFAFHKEVAKGCFVLLVSNVNKKYKLYIP